jgi:SAM-dependent methyltransferase
VAGEEERMIGRWRTLLRRGRRAHTLLDGIDRRAPGLEIGPSHRPVAAKRDGFNVRILDHMDAAGLRAKYADHGVDIAAIEEVDYVWRGEPLEDLVGGSRFAWIVASHVIEHVPDFVGFLRSCERMLVPGGLVSLAVPDKRRCFDCERENSSLASIIDAGLSRPTIPSPGTAAEYFLKVRRKGGLIAWSAGHRGTLEPVHGLQDALDGMARAREGRHQDLHAWVFTCDSFRQVIRDLVDLGLIGLRERSFTPTRGCEFFIQLEKTAAGRDDSLRRGR